MTFSLISFLPPLILAFSLAFIFTFLTIRFYRRQGWLEDPQQVKFNKATHTYPVPRGGGWPIFFSLFLTAIIFLPLDTHLRGILAGAAVLTLTGFLDDLFDLNPYLRLGLNFLAAGLVISAGIGITFISNPFGGIVNLNQPLADLFALLWITALINMVNWSKGFDGQLPGIVVIASLTIALFSTRFSADITQWPVAILAIITTGAYLGFLPFNFYPQKIMPGYGGGGLAGYLLAVLAILSTAKVGTAMMVLGLPIIDALYTIIRRLIQKKSPFWGDRGHLHHKILDKLHWGKRRTALFYWSVTALLGLLALSLNSQQKLYTMIALVIIVGEVLLWLNYSTWWSDPSAHDKRSKT